MINWCQFISCFLFVCHYGIPELAHIGFKEPRRGVVCFKHDFIRQLLLYHIGTTHDFFVKRTYLDFSKLAQFTPGIHVFGNRQAHPIRLFKNKIKQVEVFVTKWFKPFIRQKKFILIRIENICRPHFQLKLINC